MLRGVVVGLVLAQLVSRLTGYSPAPSTDRSENTAVAHRTSNGGARRYVVGSRSSVYAIIAIAAALCVSIWPAAATSVLALLVALTGMESQPRKA